MLEVFREGVRGPEEEWQGRGLLENFWLVLEGEGLSLEIWIDSWQESEPNNISSSFSLRVSTGLEFIACSYSET